MKEYVSVSRAATGGMVIKVSLVDGPRSVRWAQKTMRGRIKQDKALCREYAVAMLEEISDDE